MACLRSRVLTLRPRPAHTSSTSAWFAGNSIPGPQPPPLASALPIEPAPVSQIVSLPLRSSMSFPLDLLGPVSGGHFYRAIKGTLSSSYNKSSAPGPCAPGINLSIGQMAQLDAGGTIDDVSLFFDSSVALQKDGSFSRTESFTAANVSLNARRLGPGPLFA